VSFENIREVVFRRHAESLYGQVKIPDGTSVELVIGKDKKTYGRIKFAAFCIRLNDLKKMIIESALQKSAEKKLPYWAFLTKPERMQRVQTFTRFTAFDFSSTQRTFCRLGNHTFFVLLLAWLTLLPTTGFLPHTSQILDMRQLLGDESWASKP
jgi:hypothetical protein